MSQKYRHECPEGCKVFIGNLDRRLTRERIRHVFGEFGRVLDVWLATQPPGFGFIMYEHRSDAKEAVNQMNNQTLSGRVLTVELATGVKRTSAEGLDENRNDRRLARDDQRRHRDRHQSGSVDRRGGRWRTGGNYFSKGDRVFYSSDFKRMNSSSNRRRSRRSKSMDSTERNGGRTRSQERRDHKSLKEREDDKSRSRQRTSDH